MLRCRTLREVGKDIQRELSSLELREDKLRENNSSSLKISNYENKF